MSRKIILTETESKNLFKNVISLLQNGHTTTTALNKLNVSKHVFYKHLTAIQRTELKMYQLTRVTNNKTRTLFI